MRKFIIILISLIACLQAFSQTENKIIRKGNHLYEDGKFKDAEISYRKAIDKKPESVKGTYNLGNSLYKQESYDEAAKSYEGTIMKIKPDDKLQLSAAYHNLGNTRLKSEKYQEAIDAYKQSLRMNPADNDTRYNLSYALNKLKQQQQNQQSQGKNDNKDNKDKQEQKSEPENGQQQPDNQDKQQKGQLSKKDAERMLQALNNDEQRTMDKVNKQKVKQVPVQVEKDW